MISDMKVIATHSEELHFNSLLQFIATAKPLVPTISSFRNSLETYNYIHEQKESESMSGMDFGGKFFDGGRAVWGYVETKEKRFDMEGDEYTGYIVWKIFGGNFESYHHAFDIG